MSEKKDNLFINVLLIVFIISIFAILMLVLIVSSLCQGYQCADNGYTYQVADDNGYTYQVTEDNDYIDMQENTMNGRITYCINGECETEEYFYDLDDDEDALDNSIQVLPYYDYFGLNNPIVNVPVFEDTDLGSIEQLD